MNQDKEIDTNRAKLRDRIIEYAQEAFSANGIKSITMDEIASSLGISKRTLYETFEDKETLLCECFERSRSVKDAKITAMIAGGMNVLEVILASYLDNIRFLLKTDRRFFIDIKKYPKAQAQIAETRRRNSENSIAFFKSGVEQGLFRDDINYEILNILSYQQLDELSTNDILSRFPLVDVYETFIFTFVRGIATDRGAEMLNKFISENRGRNREEAALPDK